jgi:hypothetical protein
MSIFTKPVFSFELIAKFASTAGAMEKLATIAKAIDILREMGGNIGNTSVEDLALSMINQSSVPLVLSDFPELIREVQTAVSNAITP